MLNFRKIHNSD